MSEQMGEFHDSTGMYYGELFNGFPHGQGTKYYTNGDIYIGEWQFGRKHGIGEYEHSYFKYQLQYFEGNPIKAFSLINSSNNALCIASVPYTKTVKKDDGFVEEWKANSKDNSFFIYFNKSNQIIFEGKLFMQRLCNYGYTELPIKINQVYESKIIYYGEHDLKGLPSGFGYFDAGSFKYIGNNFNFLPHGKGKIVTICGKKLKGNFNEGILEGQCTMKTSETKLSLFILHERPVECGYITCQDFKCNIIFTENVSSFHPEVNDQVKIMKYYLIIERNYAELISSYHIVQRTIKMLKLAIRNKTKITKMKYDQIESWGKYETESSLKSPNMIKDIKNDKICYLGEFEGNVIQGKGKMIFINGDAYEGEWRDNKFEGMGKYFYQNGCMYCGEFKDGLKHGQGCLKKAGMVYKGMWENDQMHGQGLLTVNGVITKGIWKENFLISFISIKIML